MNEDNFYYIMDYSGNYYRLNGEDELVVADVKDATIFTDDQIQDRLVGKKAAFYCTVPADGEAEINVQEESEDEYVSPVKDIIYEEVHDPVEKSVASYDLSEINWKEYLTHFTYMAEGARNIMTVLQKNYPMWTRRFVIFCIILNFAKQMRKKILI